MITKPIEGTLDDMQGWYDYGQRLSTVHHNARETGSSHIWAATQVVGIGFYDAVGVGDMWSAASGEEYITFEKLGPWERVLYGVSGAVKLAATVYGGTRAVGDLRGWRAGRCSWNPFSTCFVAGTQVHSPEDVSGTWYAIGSLALVGGVGGLVVSQRKKKKNGDSMSAARDDVFAAGNETLWELEDDLPADVPFDPDCVGKDFGDLKQQRLDRLCELLFCTNADDTSIEIPTTHDIPRHEACIHQPLRTAPAAGETAIEHGAIATVVERRRQRIASNRVDRSSRLAPSQQRSTVRQWVGSLSLLAGVMIAAFCFFQGSATPVQVTKAIEDLRPGDRVITNASDEALASAVADNNGESLSWNSLDGSWAFDEESSLANVSREEADDLIDALRFGDGKIVRSDYRLVVLRAEQRLPDGTINDINVETIQHTNWIHENEAHVGADAPLPLDILEMGLPEDLRAKVVDILPCPPLRAGPGKLVLTTINSLSNDVIELTLRDHEGNEETLRPTSNHKFYSVSQGIWLGAADLQVGERLEGTSGLVTVAGIEHLPGTQRVYNLTVQGEHVYRVAGCGVLVHNNRCYHGYAIFNKRTGKVYKFGISRAKNGIAASGQSKRARAQLTRISKRNGVDRDDLDTVVLRKFKNNEDMLQWERDTVGTFHKLWDHTVGAGRTALPDNILPKGTPF